MRLAARGWFGLIVCGTVLAGCGEKPAGGPMPGPFDASQAGPNRRFKGKEQEYKKALGKDGRLMYKPGMKNPSTPATPATPPKP